MGRFSTNFRTRAQAGLTPIGALRFVVGSTTIQVSDGGLVSSSQGLFKGRIVSWGGAVQFSAHEHDGTLQSPTLSATIKDPDDELKALFTGADARNVIGGAVTGWLLYDDLEFADWFQFFGGFINEWSYVDRNLWEVGFRFNDFALAAETGELFVQTINDDDFTDLADADPESAGIEIPLIYGKNYATEGAVVCPYVAADGDEDDATAAHRYLVGAGFLQDIDEIFVGGASSVASPVKGTNWFWTVRNGKYFTEVGFGSAQTDPVTVNVHGFTDAGEGSVTLGDLITNKAKQIEHLLTNFAFNRWTSGDWFTEGTDSPIDTASITALAAYFDGFGFVDPVGSNVLTRQSSLSALNDWKAQNQVAVWWTEAGQLRFKVRSPFDTDIYLDNNTPANWPWFKPWVHGRGPNPIYPLTRDGRIQTDRVTYRCGWTPNGGFAEERNAQDFERVATVGYEIQARWAKSDGTNTPEYDAPSRRLRRTRFPLSGLQINASVAFLDPHLLEPMLISDPDAPTADGLGWGDDALWKPRLHSFISRALDLNAKTVSCVAEDEVPYRATAWDTGKGDVAGGKGDGVGILCASGLTGSRSTKAWVEQSNKRIVEVAANIGKRTPSGFLFEMASTNGFSNPAFTDGLTDWNQTTPGNISLDTAVRIFENLVAQNLSGTNQSVKLLTSAGPVGSAIDQTTPSYGSGSKIALSIVHIDTGAGVRVRIQNDTTGNYLQSDGTTWNATATAWAPWATRTEKTRDVLKFLNDASTSTLTIEIISAAGVGNYTHVLLAQVQPFIRTSPLVSASGGTFTSDNDELYHDNASGVIVSANGGYTFRALFQPIFDQGDLSGDQDEMPIFHCVDTGGTGDPITLHYRSSTGVFIASGTGASVSVDVVEGEVYRVVYRVVGAKGELGYGQRTEILDVYDPVAGQWLQDVNELSTSGAEFDSGGKAYFGTAPSGASPSPGNALSCNGYLGWELQRHVLSDAEARAFP